MTFSGTKYVGGTMSSTFMMDNHMINEKMSSITRETPGTGGGSVVRILFDESGAYCAFITMNMVEGGSDSVRGSASQSGGDTAVIYSKDGNSCDGPGGPFNM
jgi:hypothetical protein